MTVEVQRLGDAFHLRATNEQGNALDMDASPDIGGHNLGFRPMQTLLAGLGGCSAIDVINILRKQQQPLRGLKVTITGEREADAVPSLFQTIHVHFALVGPLDEEKVRRAVALTMDKYCSVAKTLEKSARLTHSFAIAHA